MAQSTKDWAKKVAKNRGEKWRKKLRSGRLEASLNPSMIAIARRMKGFQQADLARKLEISPSTLGAIERGRRRVTQDIAQTFAKHLSVSVAKLFKPQGKKLIAVISRPSL